MIPETVQSIERPAIIDVIKHLQEITKIPQSAIILFPGDAEKNYNPGSSISDKQEDRTRFSATDYIEISVEIDHDKNSMSTTAVTKSEHPLIFNDEKLGVIVKPVYSKMNVTITCKFISPSKSVAKRWRDDIRMRVSMMRDVNLHDLTYHYTLPKDVLTTLKEIHRLRENVAGYGEEFNSYFYNNSTTRATQITNQSGTISEIAIAERQMRVVGYFDFEGFPDKENKDSEKTIVENQFTYTFAFDKAIGVNFRFPVMIHNQIMDERFRPDIDDSYDIDKQEQSFSMSIGALNNFESQLQQQKYIDFNYNIKIPEFDEFTPASITPGTVSLFSVLCEIDPANPLFLFNLRELGQVVLDTDILDFISKSEYQYITAMNRSVFLISLYRNNILRSEDYLTVNSNLDVYATKPLDIRENNRVRFSIVSNLDYVPNNFFDRIKPYPQALVKIGSSVVETLRYNKSFQDLKHLSYVTKNDILSFVTGKTDISKLPIRVPQTEPTYVTPKGPANYQGYSRPTPKPIPVEAQLQGYYVRPNGVMQTVQTSNIVSIRKD